MPSLTLPAEVSVMTLPETVFFPKVLLPLHIFEAKYRLMLQKALEGSRIFCVSLASDKMKPHSIASVGIIRACVDNADG
ncbi:MAG: LON peptidase substrate-binding domain-containing protein, partial [Verrucomicrobiota bacterium]